MSTLRALLVQARLCWQEPAENRRQLQALVDEALGDGEADAVDLIVLPETFTTGFLGDTDKLCESMDGPTVGWMREMAQSHGAAVAGSVVIEDGGARYNRFLLVGPDGLVGHYDKRHLFAHAGEDGRYTAGNRRVVLSWMGWRICPQICYDLRFPAWCRNRDDYDLLLLVANWPVRRVGAWTALLKARAIENQAYVIGVNRVGRDGKGFDFPGRSVAYDPLGEAKTEFEDQVCARVVELDHEELNRVRKELPFLADADDFELGSRELGSE